MNKHLISAALLWIVLTAVGEGMVLLDLLPTVGSTEAEDFDKIFNTLMLMGTPVMMFVFAVLAYAFLEFRAKSPDETGATFRGTGMVPKAWLAITGGLAALVMVYPGLTGLHKLQADPKGNGWGNTNAQMTIHVTGMRWAWQYEYKEAQVQILPKRDNELVLPINTEIKFEINSIDVLHSFWIPAFRMKIDAIPGRTTYMTVKPTELGTFKEDEAFRVQCAELCGQDHSTMATIVHVVSQEEFNAWVAKQPKVQSTPTPAATKAASGQN